jgi:endonuclease/exonuclease/phosphatase family metal-dependent hydrolase
MKVLSLNTWAGALEDLLIPFIAEQGANIDGFMLQEVTSTSNVDAVLPVMQSGMAMSANLFEKLQDALPNHTGYFAQTVQNFMQTPGVSFGNAVFLSKSLNVQGVENTFIIGELSDESEPLDPSQRHPRILQRVSVILDTKQLTLANYHGLHTGSGKEDTPERIEQSRKIAHLLVEAGAPFMICGDFNLSLETESLAILAAGNQNLIANYSITSTRSSHYPHQNRFADYMIASPEIKITHFEVLPAEVSDHLALVSDFTL